MGISNANRRHIRRYIHEHLGPEYNLSREADLLIFLNYTMFLKKLGSRVYDKATANKKSVGRRVVHLNDEQIIECAKEVLREFRG